LYVPPKTIIFDGFAHALSLESGCIFIVQTSLLIISMYAQIDSRKVRMSHKGNKKFLTQYSVANVLALLSGKPLTPPVDNAQHKANNGNGEAEA